MRLVRLLRKLKRHFLRYEPCIEIFISKRRLIGNLKIFQEHYPQLTFAPVLKSNAYGHGLVPVARILDKENIAFFVLDSLYEAMMLDHEDIKSEILVIGYTSAENIKNTKLTRVAFTITSIQQLQEIAAAALPKIKIHLKIDTGMHRQGILPEHLTEAVHIIKTHPNLVLAGLCSHLADADALDALPTERQIKQWEAAAAVFQKNFPAIKYYHLANTAGTFYAPSTYGNVARLGIGLYGINASPHAPVPVQPVLMMQSIISSVRSVAAGECVGYNRTYQADAAVKVATVPVGYFEGVDRRLSNCGFFKIQGIDCPFVGRVSMNITSIDVTALPSVSLGDTVVVISNNQDDKNSIANIARLTQTIPYEVLVRIPQHLRHTIAD